jgi:hypothetical protein
MRKPPKIRDLEPAEIKPMPEGRCIRPYCTRQALREIEAEFFKHRVCRIHAHAYRLKHPGCIVIEPEREEQQRAS